METLIEEKIKRKSDKIEENGEEDLQHKKTANNSEISLMVKAIKSKTDVLKRKNEEIISNKNSKLKK